MTSVRRNASYLRLIEDRLISIDFLDESGLTLSTNKVRLTRARSQRQQQTSSADSSSTKLILVVPTGTVPIKSYFVYLNQRYIVRQQITEELELRKYEAEALI
jgi:hypothetical protein